jgi:hypothetical protein
MSSLFVCQTQLSYVFMLHTKVIEHSLLEEATA